MELRRYKLRDIASVDISSVDKKSYPGQKPVRLCNFTDVYYNWAITAKMEEKLMESTASEAEIERYSLRKGQVCITKDSETRDDIGVAAYIADTIDNVVLGYHCAVITPDEDKLDGAYLNAFLHSSFAQRYFECNASGSGQRYTLTLDSIKDLQLVLPSIEEQRKVAKLLSGLDRKIELNRSINANLEAMAKQLYDYWFVQFDFPDENGRPYKSSGGKMVWNEKLKREIPEGWECRIYNDILAKYPTTKKYGTDEYLSNGLYPIIDQGPKYIVGWTNDKNTLLNRVPATLFGDHSTCVKLITKPFARGADGTQIIYSNCSRVLPYYLYECINHLIIPNPGYSRHFKYLKELPIVVPSQNVADVFEKICSPIFSKWSTNIYENEELLKQRDELLPLLMNGQVSITE